LWIAAAVTWAAHSSVATILLSCPVWLYSQFVTPYAAIRAGAGRHLGSAIIRSSKAHAATNPESYRLPSRELLNRLVGVVLVRRPASVESDRVTVAPDMAKLTAQFHVAFNVATAGWRSSAARSGLPRCSSSLFPCPLSSRPRSIEARYLDESRAGNPVAGADRRCAGNVRMGDMVESMLQQVMTALLTNDRSLVAHVSRMDNTVDRLDEAIKLYLTS